MKTPIHLQKVFHRAALLGGCLCAVGSYAQATPRFEFGGLRVTGASSVTAADINDNGQIVGNARFGEVGHAILFENGVARDLHDTLGGGGFSAALGINNQGQIVGQHFTGGYILSNGVVRDIGVFGGTNPFSSAQGINDNGQVAGFVSFTTETVGRTVAATFQNNSLRSLGTLSEDGDGSSRGFAINAGGQIVGSSVTGNGVGRTAFIYSNGVMQPIRVFAGLDSEAASINAGGEVVGSGRLFEGTQRHAFHYVNGVTTDLGFLGGVNSFASDINDSGQIVGRADTATAEEHATLWNHGVIHDLNALAPSTWTLRTATAINRHGQIVGSGLNRANAAVEGFVLTLHPDWQGGSGNWDDGSRWNFAGMGSFGMAPGTPHDVLINPDGNATINGGANASVRNLTITGNAGKLVTFNLNGGSTTSMQGMTLNHATLAGSGTLEGGLTVNADSRVQVAGGDRMQLHGGQIDNAGLIRILGSGGNRAALEAGGRLVNVGGGAIDLENAELSVLGGLENHGQIKVSFGASSIGGELTTVQDGKIILSGSSETTFWDGVTMQSGSEFRLASAASAVFFGQVIVRNGAMLTGTGTSFYEGGLSLGNSPGMATNAGSVGFGLDNVYLAEIGGLRPGEQFDQLQVGGKLSFGGTLKLMWWDNFSAKAGDVFDLFDWGNSAGHFASIDTGNALLADGLRWDFSRLYASGEIGVAAVPLPGAAWLFVGGLLTVLRFNRNAKAGNPI